MKIRYTPAAFASLQEIISYINAHHPQRARNVLARIKATIDRLENFPHIGILTDKPETRRIAALPYPYLIFYKVTDEEIIIRSVRHAARKPE
jgi:plasmid stabilization system protein ParE